MDDDSVVPYVLKELPSTKKEVQALVKKYTEDKEEKETAKIANLVIQRLRDYHDPLATGSEESEEVKPWNQFVMALL